MGEWVAARERRRESRRKTTSARQGKSMKNVDNRNANNNTKTHTNAPSFKDF